MSRPVLAPVLEVVGDHPPQPVLELDGRLPAKRLLDLVMRGVHRAHIDRLLFGRPRHEGHRATAYDPYDQLGHLAQAIWAESAEVERLTVRAFVHSSAQERVNSIVHVREVT